MTDPQARVIGRYALYDPIAAGGMATVHLGRLLGPVGFSRTVAIKRLHTHFAADPEFVSMFVDEARVAARIRHPNVVPTLDVVATGGELFLVMEYVAGESLARLSRLLHERQQAVPLPVIASTMAGVLHGLHAAHEATDERGSPLGIVHRDVSPQNVLVGTDGVARVLDFGVAKAAGRMQTTREGQIKGKLAYMPPEQLRGGDVTRQSDIYAAGVMIWELVTGARLFSGDSEGVIIGKVLEGRVERPSEVLARTGKTRSLEDIRSLDALILRALSMNPDERHATARELAIEIERSCPLATSSEIGDWIGSIARDVLTSRAALIAEIESSASLLVDRDGGGVLPVLNTKPTPGPPTPRAPGATRRSGAPPRNPSAPYLPPHAAHAPPAPAVPTDPMASSQPSSMSVATAPPGGERPSAAKKRATIALSALLLLGIGVLGSGIVIRKGKRASTAPEELRAVDPELGAAAPPAPSAPPPVIVEALAAPAEAAEPLAPVLDLDGAETAAAQATTASSTDKRPPAASGAKGRPSGAAASAPSDCTTPFWYDEHGVKKYKAHCLGE